MAKTPPIVSVLLMFLLVTTIVPVTEFSSGEETQKRGVSIKEGNRVYVDDAFAYISASPDTISGDGYVYLNLTSRTFIGEMDLCFGFGSQLAYPTSLEIYDPHTVVAQHELNLSAYLSARDYRVSYNFTKQVSNMIYDGCLAIEQDSNFVENRTLTPNWQVVLSQYFDVGNLASKMFYWNTTENVEWRSLAQGNGFNETSFSFMGMNTWYESSIEVRNNKECFMRLFLTLVPSLDQSVHEFLVALKPHQQTYSLAIANNAFSYLDPWYYSGWSYKRSHFINPAGNAGIGYQVRIWVHYGIGYSNENDVYCNSHCRSDFKDVRFTNKAETASLNYWYEAPVDGVALFWVQIPYDLSSVGRYVYIYYGNLAQQTSTSNGAATFPGFFDDFSSSPNGWTLSNSVISGGQLDMSIAAYPNVAHAYKSRPSGYDNYRFRFIEKTTTNMGWQAYARERGTPPDNTPLIFAYDYWYNPISLVHFRTQGNVATSPILGPTRDANWHKIEVTKFGSSYTLFWDFLSGTCTDGTAETGSNIGFCHLWSNTAHLNIDWVFLSRYVYPEPQNSFWSGELPGGQSTNWWSDDFNDNSLNYSKWSTIIFNGGSVAEVNQRIEATGTQGGSGVAVAGIVSAGSISLDDASVETYANVNTNHECDLQISLNKTTTSDPYNQANWYRVVKFAKGSNQVYVQRRIGGGTVTNLLVQAWQGASGQLKIIKAGGTISFYENGVSLYSETYQLSSSTVYVDCHCSFDRGFGNQSGTGYFDDFKYYPFPQTAYSAVTLWGTQQYAEEQGGPNERVLSGQVSNDIASMFSVRSYGWIVNGWGNTTQPATVYSVISSCDSDYSFSVFLYKGHSYPVNCNVPGCQFQHYGTYDNEGPPTEDNCTKDYLVHGQLFAFTHKLVVLWSCGTAWANATGNFSGTHSCGWDASFMGSVDTTDAYTENSDTSGRCFIGFDNFSILYTNTTGYLSYNYGDFIGQFFYHLLQGRTVRDALNRATWDTHDSYSVEDFADCPLYKGYWMWDPRQTPWTEVKCWMKVWGDGDLIIPH